MSVESNQAIILILVLLPFKIGLSSLIGKSVCFTTLS